MLAILHGGNKVEATWMTDHIDIAKWHWKNKRLILSSWWQKTHVLLPFQFRFARLSLVKITPLRRYHSNTLICNGSFNFQSLLLLILSLGKSGWISALYMDATQNLPFSCRFQQNYGYFPNVGVRHSKIQVYKSLLNDTFRGKVSNTLAMISPLWRTMLYNAGYCSRREVAPSHLSSQNLISDPSLMEKSLG
jgi:hypothetical protein